MADADNRHAHGDEADVEARRAGMYPANTMTRSSKTLLAR
jgi:hypothetical protein